MSKNQLRVRRGRETGIGNLILCSDSKRSLFASCFPMVGVAGFEPATLRLSSACSNQLSYTPGWLVEAWGFEPQTYSLQSYRSTN
jgi:hypothetical protein